MSASKTLNGWAAMWADFVWSGLVDATLLLVVISMLWVGLRRHMSAQLGYCLFLLRRTGWRACRRDRRSQR